MGSHMRSKTAFVLASMVRGIMFFWIGLWVALTLITGSPWPLVALVAQLGVAGLEAAQTYRRAEKIARDLVALREAKHRLT